jgi:hypothetical protein
MRWSAGSLVRAHGRDWVALPAAVPDLVRPRPLTGQDHQEIGLFLPLERQVEPASFPRPDPGSVADAAAARLLFDAARLSLRSGAAPFRSLGRISVNPRPYQFVRLIMALRLDPVRLLIADDVGVGKTIEAGMIARELLDRGIVRRLCVLCPAHLCDQWERELPRQDLSIYEHYPHLVASIDFVKAERHRGPFLRTAPDLAIVDEAHGAARPRADREHGQHQRHELVHALAADRERHLLLVTATPHSGIEESFRSLLGLLDPGFEQPPSGSVAAERRRLLPHVIQRGRKDVEPWLGAETPFPERVAEEIRHRIRHFADSVAGAPVGISVNVHHVAAAEMETGASTLSSLSAPAYDIEDDAVLFSVQTNTGNAYMVKYSAGDGVLWVTPIPELAMPRQCRFANHVLGVYRNGRIFKIDTRSGTVIYDRTGWTGPATPRHFWDGQTGSLLM